MTSPTQEVHDRVVRFIADYRFPFPGQKDWPVDSKAVTNVGESRKGFPTAFGTHYPDLVVVGPTGDIREVAEIETDVDASVGDIWAAGSAASDNRTRNGVKHFFVYVPEGKEDLAKQILESNKISYAGLRTYSVDQEGRIRIVPIETPSGDPKDHVESLSC